MPRKKEGLGPAFSCRLRGDQDKLLRAQAKKDGLPLVTVLRLWINELMDHRGIVPAQGEADGQPV